MPQITRVRKLRYVYPTDVHPIAIRSEAVELVELYNENADPKLPATLGSEEAKRYGLMGIASWLNRHRCFLAARQL